MRSCATGLVLSFGFLLGVADWATDWLYYIFNDFDAPFLKDACFAFVLLQPTWYLLLYIVYISSRPDLKTTGEKMAKYGVTPVYTSLMYFKVLGTFSGTHRFFCRVFGLDDKKFKFFS